MRILLTGADGFIGKNMKTFLHEALLIPIGSKSIYDDAGRNEIETFDWVGEEGGFPNVQGFDRVIHLGAESSTTEWDVEKVMKRNHDFSCKLLLACNEHRVDFQYASSASVYGGTPGIIDQGGFLEDDAKYPQHPYAWSKYLFDRLVEKNIEKGLFDIKVQGFRYFNVYGPYITEMHKGDQASIWTKSHGSCAVQLFEGSDKILRDFIHVEDVCKIHHVVAAKDWSGIVNVGTGVASSFKDVGEAIVADPKSKAEWIDYIEFPEHLKATYQYETLANVNLLRELIGDDYKFRTITEPV